MKITIGFIFVILIVLSCKISRMKDDMKKLLEEKNILEYSMNRTTSELFIEISKLENSIECIEYNIKLLEDEKIHELKDDIYCLREHLLNVGKIAVSNRKKLNT